MKQESCAVSHGPILLSWKLLEEGVEKKLEPVAEASPLCLHPKREVLLMPSSPVMQSSESATSSPWFFDSGATSHVTYDQSQLQLSQGGTGTSGPSSVTVGNGHAIPVVHSGQSHIPDSSPRELSQGTVPSGSFF